MNFPRFYSASNLFKYATAVLLLLVATGGQLSAQEFLNGTTPAGLASGAPAGSYPLSDFDTVNYYNGNLNFSLPLAQVASRGNAHIPLSLKIDQRWRVEEYAEDTGPSQGGVYYYRYAVPSWWNTNEPEFEPARLIARRGGIGWGTCGQLGNFVQVLSRLTFTTLDGTEYEFRDRLHEGRPLSRPICEFNGMSRGKVFVTADGVSATYIADNPYIEYGHETAYPVLTGYIFLRDGTRYRIGEGGEIDWMQDRNGNRIEFIYEFGRLARIKDSLNREVVFSYNVNEAPYGLHEKIEYKGFGGATRTIRITYAAMDTTLRAGQTIKTYQQLFPFSWLNAANDTEYNPTVKSAVYLPDGRSYKFKYNSYGELARVELPTGGALEYDWEHASGVDNGYPYGVTWDTLPRRLTRRRIYKDSGITAESELFVSGLTHLGGGLGFVTAQQKKEGVLLSSEKHYYHGVYANPTGPSAIEYTPWRDGKEYETQYLSTDGNNTVLRSVSHRWEQRAPVSWWTQSPDLAPPNDPRLAETTTRLWDTNQVSSQKFYYDRYNNLTKTEDYGYGTGAPGALIRYSQTDYLTSNTVNGASYDYACDPTSSCNNSPSLNANNLIHIRSLPTRQSVYDAVGVEQARITYEYDNYTTEAGHAALIDRPGITGLDAAYTVNRQTRGNMTRTSRWLLPNTEIKSYVQYDIAGNAVKAIDGRGQSSTVVYADNFADGVNRNTYAFTTSTTSAVPDPSNQRATNTPLTASTVYDFSTGKVIFTTDANGKTTAYQYGDALDRLSRVDSPDGGWTTYWYDRNAHGDYVGSRTAVNAAQNTEGYQFFDGLGRSVRSFQLEGSQWITSDTQYDAMGRVWRVSNPYLSGGSGTAINPSGNWTTSAYDALGRVSAVTTPDGAVTTTDYSGNTVTGTDQAGKRRRSVADALGRLSAVYEDPNVTGYMGLNYLTNYTYDVLGNLRKVDQGGQLRYFMYDSLSRLIRARNPEQAVNATLALQDSFKAPEDAQPNGQWTLSYTYDANGNLATKTDARNITTTHQYDNLNRLIQTNYTDGTPYTLRTYDHAPTNGRGRFYADYESSASGTLNYIEAYDAMGRPTAGKTDFYLAGTGWIGYTTSRAYDKLGHVTQQTYPSGHTVNYSQFDAAGRLKQFNGNLGDGTPRAYSANIEYDEASRPLQEQFGTETPLYNKLEYNARGQKTAVRLSTLSRQAAYFNWNRGALIFDYGTTANNGNLVSLHNWVPFTVSNDEVTSGTSYQQSYSYDSLNRLTLMQESRLNEGFKFQQGYLYDRWGNRTINQGATTQTLPAVMRKAFTVDAQTNRLGVPSGQVGVMGYDPAGNLNHDSYTGSGNRTYDAEGRMTSATTGINSSSYYTYDAAGKRVRRQNSNEAAVWQVYGFDSELLAEYAAGAAPTSPRKEYGYRNGELLVVAESSTAASQPDGAPYGGTPAALPGIIEAEHFNQGGQGVAYQDTTPGTHGQDYDQAGYPPPALRQPTDVDIYRATGVYSNAHLIMMQAGDRTSYTTDIAASGTYTLEARVAWGGVPGGTFHVEVDGVDKTGPVQIPDTGWTMQLITKTGVQLSAGRHVLRVVADTNAANGYTGDIDYIRLTQVSSTLAGHWKFNEGGGLTTGDASGGGHTGTLSGAAWATAGQFDGAVSFDGVDDYVGMGAPTGLAVTNAVTMSAWIYPMGAGSDPVHGGVIMCKEGEYEVARFADGTIRWALANSQPGWAWVNTGYVAALNQWTHVAVVYDGAWVMTYANNVLVHTQAATGVIGDAVAAQNDFRVGGRQAVAQYFQGRIDEVRVYRSALGAGEVAELATPNPVSASIQWLVTDHLGTPRMVVDVSGSLAGIRRHDYLPFGEELTNQGGRTSGEGFAEDHVRQQFTGYERDDETGLDYAEARYFSNIQGRFTSVDPLTASARVINPQTWNRYTYVLNNPLRLIDPSGLQEQDPNKLASQPPPVIVPPLSLTITVFDWLFGDYYQDPGSAGSAGQAFRDPLSLLINPGTVGAMQEVGIADTNLVTGILRGASPQSMGVPSGMRLLITPTIYEELLQTPGVTAEGLDAALNNARIDMKEVSESALSQSMRVVVPLFNKEGNLSTDLSKAVSQMSDLRILAEARAANLPLLTNDRDFQQNAVGGGTLAKRAGVDIIDTRVVPQGLPKMSDVSKDAVKRIIRRVL